MPASVKGTYLNFKRSSFQPRIFIGTGSASYIFPFCLLPSHFTFLGRTYLLQILLLNVIASLCLRQRHGNLTRSVISSLCSRIGLSLLLFCHSESAEGGRRISWDCFGSLREPRNEREGIPLLANDKAKDRVSKKFRILKTALTRSRTAYEQILLKIVWIIQVKSFVFRYFANWRNTEIAFTISRFAVDENRENLQVGKSW